jgi:hypothetical protein
MQMPHEGTCKTLIFGAIQHLTFPDFVTRYMVLEKRRARKVSREPLYSLRERF